MNNVFYFVFPSNITSVMLIETSSFQFHECIIKDSETLHYNVLNDSMLH